MNKQRIARTGMLALAIALGIGAARTTSLEAAGYIVTCGRGGEVQCQPGGEGDCSGVESLPIT